MSATTAASFGLAIAALLLAHVARAARHTLLFSREDIPERFDLLLALSLSYALNTVVPFRIGELVRVAFITIRLRLRVAYVAATVAAERLTDLAVVAVILVGAAGLSDDAAPLLRAGAMLAGAAGALLLAAVLVGRYARVRRVVWAGASIFNATIRLSILEFVWSFAQLVRRRQVLTPRYALATTGMWTLYLLAYALFASAAGVDVSQVFASLLGAPLRPLLQESLAGSANAGAAAFVLFTTLPVAAIVVYGVARQRQELRRSLQFVRRFGLQPAGLSHPPVGHRFRHARDYAAFLGARFGAADHLVATFGEEGVEDAIVHRLLPGGSEAITAVVEVDGALGIRKFAAAAAGEKLEAQARWLRTHGSTLSLADVTAEQRNGDRFRYDMPYLLSARDFYEVIHTAPLSVSRRLLHSVVDDVSCFHQRGARGTASDQVVDAYLDSKVCANARKCLQFARVAVDDEYSINGDAYSLADWDRLLDLDWLRAQVRSRATATVHGDLTVENIIVCPERPKGWYLIDPNADNLFDTPLIDWAKLMQSLHLGYEGLNRAAGATAQDGAIRVAFTRSSAYAELHADLAARLEAQLGAAVLREVAFHEIVNYLRLTPYRMRHGAQQGLTFFACTSVLLRRYLDQGDA